MINFADLNLRSMPHIEQILDSLKVEHNLNGKQLQFLNPLRDDSNFGSASINIETGLWADFASADDAQAKGGDLISLVAYLTGTNQSLAAKKLESFLSEPSCVAVETIEQVKAVGVVKSVDTETHIVIDGVHYDLVYPVPDSAPFLPRDFGPALGEPSEIYPYKDDQGRLLGYMLRFDLFSGKTIRPATLWIDEIGKYKWNLKGFPTPRPLYNLHLLTERPDAPVLIVEGEKSANAASLLFPDHVVVTTMHGSKSPEKSDLTPLIDRNLSMWADYDGPGQRYEESMVRLLRLQDDKASVSIMLLITDSAIYELDTEKPKLESGFIPSEGWDAADAVAEGWTAEHIKLLPTDFYIKSEPDEPEPEAVDYMVGNFRISEAGVGVIRLNKDGDSYETWVCSKLEVKALSRDMHSGNWGLVLEFSDKDHHLHKWCMPKSMLVDDRGYRGELLKMGLDIATGDNVYLSAYLQTCNPTARVLAVKQPGWYKNMYVLPNRVIGSDSESVMIQTNNPHDSNIYLQQGDLLDWQENVGKYCIGNSRMILSICAGLSGPWLKVLAEESGGIHFVGESSSGKTTAVQVAASLWGAPEFITSWRTTDNALESIAALHNDNLLVLDELATVDADKAGEIAYMLGNGQGKSRATRSAEIQQGKSWKLVYLSTGEISLADHMGTVNKRTMAGQEVRLVNIPSDGGQNMGLFENIHSVDGPQAFSQLMKNNTATYYGSPGIAMLEALVSNNSDVLRAQLKDRIQSFINTYVPVGANGQVLRIAQRFGLFAAIGEFAISQKILPWPEGHANAGVSACFTSWLSQRGGVGAQENEVAISQVRRFIEMNGDARFTNWVHGFEADTTIRTINRAGFRRQTDDGRTEYMIFPEVWKTEVCAGLSPTQVTKSMSEAGLLEMNNGRTTQSMRLPGLGNTKRVYVVKADIMGTTGE